MCTFELLSLLLYMFACMCDLHLWCTYVNMWVQVPRLKHVEDIEGHVSLSHPPPHCLETGSLSLNHRLTPLAGLDDQRALVICLFLPRHFTPLDLTLSLMLNL